MSSKKSKEPNYQLLQIILGFAGTALVAYFGYLGIKTQSETPVRAAQTASAETNTAATQNINSTLTSIPVNLIFGDTFDSDKDLWSLEDYEDEDFSISKFITNGTYHRVMKTSNISNGNNTFSPIPNVSEPNFCLLFDAKVNEASNNTAILIYARTADLDDAALNEYYRIAFKFDGSGEVTLDISGNNNQKQIAAFNNTINWKDGLFHKIQISLQGNEIEVKELPDKILVQKIISEGDLLLHSSKIRIGNQLTTSNQIMDTEFDNLYVYDKCP